VGDEHFPVESINVLMFARAIGDDNPIFRDRDAARAAGLGDIAAPLTFVQASAHSDPGYLLHPRPGEPWFGSGREPGTRHPELTRTLHAEQHFEYHRPLVVGDVLTWRVVPGETWTKQSRSGGVLEFEEVVTEYRDAHDELVVTSRSVTAKTEPASGDR
jgi:acyl dehydratase